MRPRLTWVSRPTLASGAWAWPVSRVQASSDCSEAHDASAAWRRDSSSSSETRRCSLRSALSASPASERARSSCRAAGAKAQAVSPACRTPASRRATPPHRTCPQRTPISRRKQGAAGHRSPRSPAPSGQPAPSRSQPLPARLPPNPFTVCFHPALQDPLGASRLLPCGACTITDGPPPLESGHVPSLPPFSPRSRPGLFLV